MSSAIPKDATCCAWVPWRVSLTNRCGKRAKVGGEGGRFFCGIHDPARLAARRAADEARWDAQREQRHRVYQVEQARLAVAEAAREAAHQRGSWDAVAEAVARLEAAEAAVKAGATDQ